MSKFTQPRRPEGMRDYLPADMQRRQYVIATISGIFEQYGYEPLQTPVMELRQTLLGKYGEDAEQLIYNAKHSRANEHSEELALRYDLTVPLVRAFTQNEAQLTLPFKRYQIAPVWRAERPQRGRFREFYQCDADTVGIATMDADAEGAAVMVNALRALGFRDFAVKINNRRLLTGIGLYAGLTGDALANLYRSIDKLDKIGIDGVRKELAAGGIADDVTAKIIDLITSARSPRDSTFAPARANIAALRGPLGAIAEAVTGLDQLSQLVDYLEALNVAAENIEIDFSMVRGLGYYTGPIFEAVLLSDDPEERVGSIAGGGRYDDLIGLFRKESLPTVGISLGIERLITIMDKRGMYPASVNKTVVQVLVSVFNAETRAASMHLAATLRAAGYRLELFMQDKALGKQFAYADKKGIPLVAVLGPDEIAQGRVKFKRLADQTEFSCTSAEAASTLAGLI